MGKGDHCAVWGCDNDRRYPERYVILPHVGILRFYTPQNKADITRWEKLISRKNFTVTKNTKVCSNHFTLGYRCRKSCPYPTIHMKGYKQDDENRRAPPKDRSTVTLPGKRKRECVEKEDAETEDIALNDPEQVADNMVPERVADNMVSNENQHNDSTAPTNNTNDDDENETDMLDGNKVYDEGEECNNVDTLKTIKRTMFIDQATCEKNCYRYTGLSRKKVDLIFGFVEEKSQTVRYWRGSVDTCQAQRRKRNCPRALFPWDEFVLTLVRTRKGFDVRFLADTFGITHGQISRIYNTWITFLAAELSFLVPWPSQAEIKSKLPKRFSKFCNTRVIIDCMELFIQKPRLPSCQKITWSNYKHWNTAKVLVGMTPCGVISFVSPLWSGSISDKEIFTRSGLINMLDAGDAVMADKGFWIRDLLVAKKVHLICPAYCKGQRLSVKGVTYSRRVAALRSHVERYILKLKLFRILSGVIPLSMKSMLDPIVRVCAALSNLGEKTIK